jgi:hypothetical protein
MDGTPHSWTRPNNVLAHWSMSIHQVDLYFKSCALIMDGWLLGGLASQKGT